MGQVNKKRISDLELKNGDFEIKANYCTAMQ